MDTIVNYFRDTWKPDYDKFNLSGWKLLDRIPKDANILDVGCGYNLFKPHFKNLYGIDPANNNADEVVSIEDFNSVGNQWDYVLCLGSLNFGSRETVEAQVERVVSLCAKDGFIIWRQNPGIGDHPWKQVEEIEFFPWTFDDNYQWAEQFNCTVTQCDWDSGNRIYAEWQKNNIRKL